MSRVSHFQRFSQPENHATNNTLLVLRHFYGFSPFKLQRALTSLLDTELSIGLEFEQQVKGGASVPDALISQQAMRIFIETKRGADIDAGQIRRHLESIRPDPQVVSSGDILIALTREPINESVRKELNAEAKALHITFVAVTFSQIVEALRTQSPEYEQELVAVVDDYESYLAEEELLEQRNQYLVVFPCGTSIAENERFGLYYEPPSRPCKRMYQYLGVYHSKRVAFVGSIEAIAIATFTNGAYSFETEAGSLTEAHKSRIMEAISETPYYDLQDNPHRFYLVGKFYPTDARKTSPGGIMGLRYLDLTKLVPKFQPRQNYAASELAEKLESATWT